MKEYSLWIVPSGNTYNMLAVLISQLSERHSTPSFEPHITLLGDLALSEEDMLFKTRYLANLIRPFKVRLTTVSYFDEYFRCLFIRADESRELLEANSRARKLFNREQDRQYMPHLSVLYGNIASETKAKIISEIGSDFDIELEVESVDLVQSSSNIEPKNWRRLKQFDLNGK